MKKTIVFGREKGDRIIQKSDISSVHAKITYLGDNIFEVEDLDSTNGTYVNGYRIRKSRISLNDTVRLSSDSELNLAKEFELQGKTTPVSQAQKKNALDFTEEFLLLKSVYDDYRKGADALRKQTGTKMALIRGAIIVPLVGLNFIPGLPPQYRGLTSLGIVAAMFVQSRASNNMDKMEALTDNFRIRYVCPNPKCRIQLGNNSWTVVHHTGKCFRCGAIYSKSKL